MNPFEIVKDSSIWCNPKQHKVVNSKDGLVRMGVVKQVFLDDITGQLKYLVDVHTQGCERPLNCVMLSRFGGVYNYEDYIYHGYTFTNKPDAVDALDAKAGDLVLVTQIDGQGINGVILGGLTHKARRSSIPASDGPQYKSEFNGVETFINKDGEYRVTFKGQPTNLEVLSKAPSSKIPPPTYDLTVGSSYLVFDKTGSFTVGDNASVPQFIKIDKPGGQISISAGNAFLKFNKQSEAVSMTAKTLDLNIANKVNVVTKELAVVAPTAIKLKSNKIGIGSDGVELLAQLSLLIDALGKVSAIHWLGTCAPLNAAGEWADVKAIQAKIKSITGSV